MIIEVKILPKKEVLDVQGRAILDTVKQQYYLVEDCNYGKCIRLKIKSDNQEESLKQAKEITESLLCNSLIEDYEVKILPI